MTAETYSLVITWTYFAIYVTIFFIVSIACVIKVDEYKQYQSINIQEDEQYLLASIWSKREVIKRWAKSAYHKKKIYFQLIPHFLDQATDFGVIAQYWSLHKLYPVGEGLGIDTLYLFVISIFVIICHRTISSFAIYRLTRNKMLVLYQMLDVLLIQCIWTNYQLNSDKPSNPQRYLQVLEAIFESSPQILISTAFLLKAETPGINGIVMISLIASMWTLLARVASDDKQMFKKEWKGIGFGWFIRVVLWRLLEITSRIALLCIVWINLGGVSILIILALEFIYLAILCFGVGSVDMMGNIMYLMAANSNKKTEEWTSKMTKIFWAYRVISAYILLITSTIFALTKINLDTDHIAHHEARYYQTIENRTGLGLFIFCWIATPIWQWIAAVILFDYDNLASVGRDVALLAEDKKFLDVLELIQFGAIFDAEHTLRCLVGVNSWRSEQTTELIGEICIDKLKEKNEIQAAFFRGCNEDKIEFIKFFIAECDVDINERDEYGRTPLFYAARNFSMETLKFLNSNQARCDIEDNNGGTVIHHMFYYMERMGKRSETRQCLEILQYLIEDCDFKVNDSMIDTARKTKQNQMITYYLLNPAVVPEEEEKSKTTEAAKHRKEVSWYEEKKEEEEDEDGDDHPIQSRGYMVILSALFLGFYISTDIALLVINIKDDCDQVLKEGDFALIGCIMHLIFIICGFGCQLIAYWKSYGLDPGSVCVYGWCGCFFYWYMCICMVKGWILIGQVSDNDKIENRQCWDILLAWNVLKSIEMFVTPLIIWCWFSLMSR